MLLISTFFLAFLSADAAKIGVFVSTLSKSQIIFGYQLANVLHSDGHELAIIRPHINPYTQDFKLNDYKEIQLDALNKNYELFDNFSHVEHEIIFGDIGILSSQSINLGTAFYKLMAATCLEVTSNKAFLDLLKSEKFDFIYVTHHLNCGLAVARFLNVRYAIFSSATLGGTVSRPFGIPQIASIMPAWMSSNTDEMTYAERINNLFIMSIESFELSANQRYTNMYREQFGSDFPTAKELAENAELALINDEELFNYPRPVSHKIVNIGGINEELDSKKPRKLSQEYVDFIGDRSTVLVSFGSVANSQEMPNHWKTEFKKLFQENSNIQFIWKYDGKDVEVPNNVMLSAWVPQTELLKSGKIALFLGHGGYNSLSESLYSATPMLLVPLFADQFRNSKLARKRGVGLIVPKTDFNSDFISTQIKHILGNSNYKTNAKKYQRLLQNKPFKAHELIIRWNKFLLENEPINLNIKTVNFIQYYCLDIIIPFIFISIIILSWILLKLARLYYWSCFQMGNKSAHLKKE